MEKFEFRKFVEVYLNKTIPSNELEIIYSQHKALDGYQLRYLMEIRENINFQGCRQIFILDPCFIGETVNDRTIDQHLLQAQDMELFCGFLDIPITDYKTAPSLLIRASDKGAIFMFLFPIANIPVDWEGIRRVMSIEELRRLILNEINEKLKLAIPTFSKSTSVISTVSTFYSKKSQSSDLIVFKNLDTFRFELTSNN